MIIRFLLSISILFLLNCSSPEVKEPETLAVPGEVKKILSNPESVQGTTFTKGSDLTFNDKGYLLKAILGDAQAILDIKYAKAFPHKFPVGTLIQYNPPANTFGEPNAFPEFPKSITVRKPVSVYGYGFPAGSTFTVMAPPGTPKTRKDFVPGITVENSMYELTINGKKIPGGSTVFFEDKDKAKQLKNPKKGEWIDL
jgi:hypothetical protein